VCGEVEAAVECEIVQKEERRVKFKKPANFAFKSSKWIEYARQRRRRVLALFYSYIFRLKQKKISHISPKLKKRQHIHIVTRSSAVLKKSLISSSSSRRNPNAFMVQFVFQTLVTLTRRVAVSAAVLAAAAQSQRTRCPARR